MIAIIQTIITAALEVVVIGIILKMIFIGVKNHIINVENGKENSK